MRKALRMGVVGFAGLTLASCGGGGGRLAHSPPSELLALLQTGRPVLDCRAACLSEWRRVQPKAMQLDASAQWSDLAVLVMQTGYQDDLSLYYLGRAAEGRAFYAAASSYYRQSMALSGTAISCENLSKLCGGVVLPSDAGQRLAATERVLVPAKPRRARPSAPQSPPAAPAATEASPASGEASPNPTGPSSVAPPAPAPAETTPAPGSTGAARALDYIEPPPARP